MGRNTFVAGMVVAICALLPGAAAAASFGVNTTADTTVAGGCTTNPACSLRDALVAAAASTDAEDNVQVPVGTYALTAGELVLGGATPGLVRVRGAGARTTAISAQGASRVLTINGKKSVAIEAVTITGGAAPAPPAPVPSAGDGGGVLFVPTGEANLTLREATVAGNAATLNGGGISSPAENAFPTKVTVDSSTVSGNRISSPLPVEGLGGGIFNFGNLEIVNSTISGNSISTAALSQGGGITAAVKTGGASTLNVLNSTIAGNDAGATGSGGGLSVFFATGSTPGTLGATIKNTIVANNTGAAGSANCGGLPAFTSTSNLSSDATCLFADPGSKQGVDPLLGALGNNGGQTDTQALQAGSPAIDAGAAEGCPAADQRGVSRSGGCDVGAYELAPAPVTTSADLQLKLKPKPKRPKAGKKAGFAMTLLNKGPGIAAGALNKGRVPASTKKIKGGTKIKGKPACALQKTKKGKKTRRKQRAFTCRLGGIASGQTVSLKILLRKPAAKPRKLRVNARASSTTIDPNPKNNRARAAARVKR